MPKLAPNRIYSQYSDKSNTVKWLNIVPEMGQQLANVYQLIRTSYNIDNATGELLNVIGRIVGVNRSYEQYIVFPIDSYAGGLDVEACQFGDDSAQCNSSSAHVSSQISDAMFRILIKSKIAKNTSDATLDGIIDALQYITQVRPIRVDDHEDMSFSVVFGELLNDVEKFMFDTFDLVPRPQGVKFRGYIESDSVTQCGGNNEISQFGGTGAQCGLIF